MDLQQLELIMNTILKMGEVGGTAFYVWLVLDKVLPLIGLLLLLWAAYSVALRIVDVCGQNDYLIELRNMLEVGSPGPITDSEARMIVKMVRDMISDNALLQKKIDDLEPGAANLRAQLNDKKNQE